MSTVHHVTDRSFEQDVLQSPTRFSWISGQNGVVLAN